MPRIFVTGANRGIGLEMTRLYVERDDTQVFAAARTPSAELQNLGATIVPLDVTDAAQIKGAVQTVREQAGGLDILVNNAGINPPRPEQNLDGITAERMLHVLNVNTVAPLMIVQAFASLLRQGKQPRVANISSQMGSFARLYPGYYAYCTSKAGLNMVTHILAHDLDGVITVTLHPGWVQTDMGGASADLTPQDSAQGVVNVIDSLTPAHNGKFLRWDGREHPW